MEKPYTLITNDASGFAVRTQGLEAGKFDTTKVESNYILLVHELLKAGFGHRTEIFAFDRRVRAPICL